jgi:hypothetical protein
VLIVEVDRRQRQRGRRRHARKYHYREKGPAVDGVFIFIGCPEHAMLVPRGGTNWLFTLPMKNETNVPGISPAVIPPEVRHQIVIAAGDGLWRLAASYIGTVESPDRPQ